MSDSTNTGTSASTNSRDHGFWLLIIPTIIFTILFGAYAVNMVVRDWTNDRALQKVRTVTVAQLADANFPHRDYHYKVEHVTVKNESAPTYLYQSNYLIYGTASLYSVEPDSPSGGFFAAVPDNGTVSLYGDGKYTIQGKWVIASSGPLLLIESAKKES